MEPDAYTQGSDAFHAGEDEAANPYDLEAQGAEHLEWNDGWNGAAELAEEDAPDAR